MVDKHDAMKDFECELCGKTFLLQWRLKKHSLIHIQNAKMCRYYVENQLCPFHLVGCKFSHSDELTDAKNADAEANQCDEPTDGQAEYKHSDEADD
jgi:hypothetical protein